MWSRCILVFSIIFAFVLGLPVTHAQEEENVVYAVLFYSPSCPHCEKFIVEDLPPIVDRFGDQLVVVYVNVNTLGGSEIYREAEDALNIPDEHWGGVPAMIIGTTEMVGGVEIPTRMPELVSAGIEAGGVGLPNIPKLLDAYAAAYPEEAQATVPVHAPEKISWQQHFEDDLVANSLAVIVLIILLMCVITFLFIEGALLKTHRLPAWLKAQYVRWILLGLTILSLVVSSTLVLEQPTIIAACVTALLALVLIIELRSPSARILPVIAVAGLLVAGYLTYIEVGENEAVCGAIGNCNVVQQSDYATFLGILPVGVMGIIGYILILGGWVLSEQTSQVAAQVARAGVFLFALVGTVFSTYLTFLEPFVIGATCTWCLTSALLMSLLLVTQLQAIHDLSIGRNLHRPV